MFDLISKTPFIMKITPDPVAFFIRLDWIGITIGDMDKIPVRWYGIAYAFGFLLSVYGSYIYIKTKENRLFLEQMIFNMFLGAVIGGRLGFIFFYRPDLITRFYKIWEGGMSFHGALLGVVLTMFFYISMYGRKKVYITLASTTPFIGLSLAFGRLANIMNGELVGRCSEWGIFWMNLGNDCIRYPSQFFSVFKDILIAIVCAYLLHKKIRARNILGTFLVMYGSLRFIVEFYRDPSWVYMHITAGQWLSIPMIFIGLFMIVFAFKEDKNK